MVAPESAFRPRRRPRHRRFGRVILIIVGVSLLLPFIYRGAGFFHSGIPGARRPGAVRGPRGGYVGSQTCRECHPAESALFGRSGHALTLREAGRTTVARKLDGRVVTDPEHPEVRWKYALNGGQLEVTRSPIDGPAERFVLQYAFGSDHHATTFVTLDPSGKRPALEHRLTHYSEGDAFRITPGQSAEKPFPVTTPHGRELPAWETVKCFRCHSTRISAKGAERLDVDELIPNVSCERCHGPAGSHVENARAGKAELAVSFGADRWTASTQMALCGQCHRHPDQALPGRLQPEIAGLARFQPVGIMQSKCYRESDGAFSCVNCHDPHARASPDRAGYESACLKCHDAGPRDPCPISPRSGCIACHMPRVDSGQLVLFTDHWIRIRKATDPPAVPSQP